MSLTTTLTSFIPKFPSFSDKIPQAKISYASLNQEQTKNLSALEVCIEKLSTLLPSNMLTEFVLSILNRLCGYAKGQSIPMPVENAGSTPSRFGPIEQDSQPAVRIIYETLFAGEGRSYCATSVLALLKKEKNTRTIEDLITVGLIKNEQLKEVELSEVKRSYLCSDQVIVSLFTGLKANYKDLEKLPDNLIKNLQNKNRQIEIMLYISNILKESISELKNTKDLEKAKKERIMRMQEAMQNPWLMQIYTASWQLPIPLAIIENNIYLTRSFLKYGMHADYKTFNGSSLFSIAAQHGNLEMIKLFLDQDIPTDAPNQDGNIPLHFAAYCGHAEVVEVLAQANPQSINQSNHFRLSPLHLAALTGNAAVIQVLLRHGAQIDATDSNQCTALHMSCATGHMDATDVLLEADASVTKVNAYGETPLACKPKAEYAQFQKRLSISKKHGLATENAKTRVHFQPIPIPATLLAIKKGPALPYLQSA